jgi:hypothetical protein
VGRILTFNCHEAYVHLLGKLGLDLDIIDALPGRYTQRWDERMRPVPRGARLLTLEQVQRGAAYDAAIAHNLTDLIQLRDLDVPKVLVLHVSLAARCDEEPGAPAPAVVSAHLGTYLELTRATAVAVSRPKAASWRLDCPVVRPCADPDEYDGFDGDLPVALRVANQVLARPRRFGWDDHRAIVGELPFQLVGHNPEIEGSAPASSWQALREAYRRHRAYVHTAGPGLDDGYNLGVVEAMTTGMPVVTTALAESPIEDGKNGLVDRDPRRLHAGLAALLVDRARALELGKRARETALREFSVESFVSGWQRVIEQAVRRWASR